MFVLAHALAFFGAYALARQLGAGRTGAAVAGAAFAVAPWRLAQAGHLQVLSTGGIASPWRCSPAGTAASLRHGYRPDRRRARLGVRRLAGRHLADQPRLRHRPAVRLRPGAVIVPGDRGGPVVRAAACAARPRAAARRLLARRRRRRGPSSRPPARCLALPYLKVLELYPYARRCTASDRALLAAGRAASSPRRLSRVSGARCTTARGRRCRGIRRWRCCPASPCTRWRSPASSSRCGRCVTAAAARRGGWASRCWPGHPVPGGRRHLPAALDTCPGSTALRTPGRLVLWTTLLLGVLAAGAVCAFAERVRAISRRAGAAAPGPAAAGDAAAGRLVLVEGLNATPHPAVPPAPAGDARRGRAVAGPAERPDHGS